MANEDLPALTSDPGATPTQFTFAHEPAGFAEEPAGPGIKRYLLAILRYKWLVVLIAGVGAGLGLVVSRYIPVEYEAEAKLWLSVRDPSAASQGPIQSGQLLQADAWAELARSFTVLDWVVADQGLYVQRPAEDADVLTGFALDSTFAPGTYRLRVSEDGRSMTLSMQDPASQSLRRRFAPVETKAVGERIGAELGFRWRPPAAALKANREVEFRVVTQRDAAKAINESLQTRVALQGNFLTLVYTGSDPQHVANVLNSHVKRYVEVATDLKKRRLEETRDILYEQLIYAENYLREAELALENFRVQTITLPSEPATPVAPGLESTRASVLSSFFELQIQRDQLQRDADAIAETIARGNGEPLSIDALNTIASVQQSPELSAALGELTTRRAELRALSQQYTTEHPVVQRAAQSVDTLERRVIPQLAVGLSAEIRNRVASLDRLVGSAADELRQIPPRVIDEARLHRTREMAANLYNDLRQRYESARLATETTAPDVRLLDAAAVPQRPASDKRMQMLLMMCLASLGLAVAVPIALERLDPKFRYPEQISGEMRLTILGAVPDLAMRQNGLFSSPDRSAAVEALRGIRLSLAHAHGSAGPTVVTITSPGSGDGKTFLSSNLALAFAELNLRTLVIDADTRRGDMHRILGTDRKPGLTEYLMGTHELHDIIRPTPYETLDFMPCGTRTTNSPELLSSARMGDLLAQIRSRYQVILIDSPPLGAGIDALVLATLCGSMVVVMRTGKTDRTLAQAKLQMVERLPVRVLGAVLNGVRDGTEYKYYSYLPGYEAGGEEAEETRLLQPS